MCADPDSQLTEEELGLLLRIEAAVGDTLGVLATAAYRQCLEIAEDLGDHRTAAAIRALIDA